jgi:DNA polymerase-3 subunit alpha
MEEGKRVHAERRAGQLSLFGSDSAPVVQEQWPTVPSWSDNEKLAREKAALGFYLSGHPLERIESQIASLRSHLLADLDEQDDQKPVTLAVMISKIRRRQTRRGEAMAILSVDDRSGSIEAVVFPSVFQQTSAFLEEEKIVIIQGIAEISREEENGEASRNQIRVNKLIPLESASEALARQIGIVLPAQADENLLFRTKEILQRSPGKLPVTLIFDEHGPDMWRVPCGDRIRVSATQQMITEIRELLGDESVKFEIYTPTVQK